VGTREELEGALVDLDLLADPADDDAAGANTPAARTAPTTTTRCRTRRERFMSSFR